MRLTSFVCAVSIAVLAGCEETGVQPRTIAAVDVKTDLQDSPFPCWDFSLSDARKMFADAAGSPVQESVMHWNEGYGRLQLDSGQLNMTIEHIGERVVAVSVWCHLDDTRFIDLAMKLFAATAYEPDDKDDVEDGIVWLRDSLTKPEIGDSTHRGLPDGVLIFTWNRLAKTGTLRAIASRL